MPVTREEYERAEQILKNFKVCDGFKCGKVLKTEDARDTWCYGIHKWWCPDCYEKIKDDND